MKTKLRRLKYLIQHELTFERVVVGVAILIVLGLVNSSISAMSRNWDLEQRINSRRQELSLLQLEIETLELENQYYASEEYQELAARAKQNKRFPGEILIYLPKNSDLVSSKHKENIEEILAEDEPSNIRQWLTFLFGT